MASAERVAELCESRVSNSVVFSNDWGRQIR
jgi:hypothetical protein